MRRINEKMSKKREYEKKKRDYENNKLFKIQKGKKKREYYKKCTLQRQKCLSTSCTV